MRELKAAQVNMCPRVEASFIHSLYAEFQSSLHHISGSNIIGRQHRRKRCLHLLPFVKELYTPPIGKLVSVYWCPKRFALSMNTWLTASPLPFRAPFSFTLLSPFSIARERLHPIVCLLFFHIGFCAIHSLKSGGPPTSHVDMRGDGGYLVIQLSGF